MKNYFTDKKKLSKYLYCDRIYLRIAVWRLVTSERGGDAYGYIRRVICLLFGYHRSYFLVAKQEEIKKMTA